MVIITNLCIYDWSFENGVKEKFVPLHQVSNIVRFYDS